MNSNKTDIEIIQCECFKFKHCEPNDGKLCIFLNNDLGCDFTGVPRKYKTSLINNKIKILRERGIENNSRET